MPLAMQAKLLRVLENGEVVRVGSNEPIRVDVRVISATNRDLAEHGARTSSSARTSTSASRARRSTSRRCASGREDIPLLIDHFIKQANETHGKKVKGITPEARRVLMAYPWPGNVRQLRNVIENMVVLAERRQAHASTTCRRRSTARPAKPADQQLGQAGRHQHRGGREGTHPQHAQDGRRQPRAGGRHPGHRRADALPQDQRVRPGGVAANCAKTARQAGMNTDEHG